YFRPEQFDEAARLISGLELGKALATLDASGAGLRLSGEQFRRCPERFRFSGLYRWGAEEWAWLRSSSAYYAALCCSGLLFLLALDCQGCKDRLDRARQYQTDWAFAHHLYGLLHGLRGDAAGAREELALALRHETYREARRRIERAVRLATG